MVTVHMQARGFTPGEKVEVILDVNNQSSQDVAYFSIGLFKVSKRSDVADMIDGENCCCVVI